MPHGDLRLARACAELIRDWHERYGVARRPSNMDDSQFDRYRDRVAYFRKADLSDPDAQEEIAQEQRSRIFEWYYGAVVPVELWQNVTRAHEIIDHRSPEHLGEAANWILERLRSREPQEESQDHARRHVQAETPGELLERAYEFYADVAAEQTSTIGGVSVLLSCSLERYPSRARLENQVILLKPEALGLRIIARGERRDDLVDALRQGDLVAEKVIGGPNSPIANSSRGGDSKSER